MADHRVMKTGAGKERQGEGVSEPEQDSQDVEQDEIMMEHAIDRVVYVYAQEIDRREGCKKYQGHAAVWKHLWTA